MDISLKRITAFVIDIVIVTLIYAAINLLPIDPYRDEYKSAYDKYTELVKENQDGSADIEEELISLNYDVYKYKTYSSLISVGVFILYFGVLQFLLKGQTFGKKLMKIKVVSSNEKDVSIFRYILRIIVLNNIWLSLINTGAVYVCKGIKFYYVTYVISMISFLLYMMNIIMIMFRKDSRGLHDFVASTKVIDVKSTSSEEVEEQVKKESIKEKAMKKEKQKNEMN